MRRLSLSSSFSLPGRPCFGRLRLPSGRLLATLICIGCLAAGCDSRETRPSAATQPAPEEMVAHAEEFERTILQPAPGVHVAIGYGLANSILVEGPDGLVVVDTLESTEVAEEVAAEFRALSPKPLKALIYTHNHGDHVFGARAFEPLADGELRVLAHETTAALIERLLNVVRPIIGRRSLRMFGIFLDQDRIHCGIGKELRVSATSGMDVLYPTETFSDVWRGDIAGLPFELHHAPGETDDQLFVWLPDSKTLMPGDNFYRAFPNLYTIRGTSYRDVWQWVESLDHMRSLKPEVLIPSHSRPIVGAENVERVLTDYRDAIQFVHDQTVRGMNQGLGPDELVEQVRLPTHLAESPFLKEHYGTVEWSVRSIFHGYLGWFDGDPANLFPHSPDERAERMVALAGGRDALVQALKEAVDAEDWPWVLELSGHIYRFDGSQEAVDARIQALKNLGSSTTNPNARHTFLTRALELEADLEIYDIGGITLRMLNSMPTLAFFRNLSVHLDPEKTEDVELRTGFHFVDTDEHFTVFIRYGVAEIRSSSDELEDLDLSVKMNASVFKEVLAQKRSLAGVLASSEIEMVRGNRLGLTRFFSYFEPQDAETRGWTY